MKLSILIPAYNEEGNISHCIAELQRVVRDKHRLPYEIVVVDDNSTDQTASVVQRLAAEDPSIRLLTRKSPRGFGRAIRSGLEIVSGDVIVVYMADLSDEPEDVIAYYRKIEEGYDCVYGSRFMKGSHLKDYPPMKLIVNRMVNWFIRILFWSKLNDFTNAFKAYRSTVIRDCGPFRTSHFNITIEMSLSALIRQYHIAQIPISWYGRSWGASNMKLREMGRRYLSTMLLMFFQRLLVSDDLLAERLVSNRQALEHDLDLETRLRALESKVEALQPRTTSE
jgi:dolichol-phosphate mannosyltransferase